MTLRGARATRQLRDRPARVLLRRQLLLTLLLKQNVEVNAKPLDERPLVPRPAADRLRPDAPARRPVLSSLVPPRAAAGGAAASAASAARGPSATSASEQRTTFADVAGHRRGRGRARRDRRLPQEPRQVPAARRRRSPRACCSPARRAPARRCWPAPWPARPTCRSSRSRPRSSSRWSSASAPRRVRDLFEQAKKAAPAIIFIDELDAIGRKRGGGGGSLGGHDEREQTLNQILTEMDGFTGSEGVIVLAATNRPEILDPALLRPGRFDRRVTVNPPDQDGPREDPRGPHALGAARRRRRPRRARLDDAGHGRRRPAQPRQRGGADRRPARATSGCQPRTSPTRSRRSSSAPSGRITLSQEERERTAYHESGHALLGMLEPGADPVRKVSIVPRGRALGVTFQIARRPTATATTRDYLRGPDRRRARRPRGRGDRLRRRHHRRRVRPRAGHEHRAPDGRPLGHVGEDRPGVRAARPERRGDALPRAARLGLARRRASSSTPRSGGSSTSATARAVDAAAREPRPARGAGPGAARARDARREGRLPRGRLRPRRATRRSAARSAPGRRGPRRVSAGVRAACATTCSPAGASRRRRRPGARRAGRARRRRGRARRGSRRRGRHRRRGRGVPAADGVVVDAATSSSRAGG